MTRNEDPKSFATGLLEAARTNPVAALLIGGGALWMLMGTGRIKSVGQAVADAAKPVLDASQENLRRAGSKAAESASSATDAIAGASISTTDYLRDATERVVSRGKDELGNVASQTREPAPSGPTRVETIKEVYSNAKTELSGLFESQPLVLGAVGLAIGAAIATAIPETDLENDLAGSLSDDFKDEAAARASAIAAKGQEGLSRMTTSVQRDAGEVVDKIKKAGADALAEARN